MHVSEIKFIILFEEMGTLGALFINTQIKKNSKPSGIHLCEPKMKIKNGVINSAKIIPK